MKRTMKAARLGLITSSAALLIQVIVMILGGQGWDKWHQNTMLICIIGVFCASLATYTTAKKKTEASENKQPEDDKRI